jgi:hypothetical protein
MIRKYSFGEEYKTKIKTTHERFFLNFLLDAMKDIFVCQKQILFSLKG